MPDLIPFSPDRCVRTLSQDDWRACIELRGELDLARAPELDRHLSAHLRAGRHLLRLDTRRVEFMDCTVLDVIVRADEQCRLRCGSLILSAVPAQLRRVLAILHLDEVLLVDSADLVPAIGAV